MTAGPHNLTAMFAQADSVDLSEGRHSYERYHKVMQDLSDLYGVAIDRVIAAFCALSPNNDYAGNLRSLVTLLYAYCHEWPVDEIECSTYRHCLLRAFGYVMGDVNFLDDATGRKIRAFYKNVLNPEDRSCVTVDGHICATWRGERLTMKQAIVKGNKEYDAIEQAIMVLACKANIRPNQYQAVLWFTRKRVFNIKAEMHRDMFLPADDVWRTYRDVKAIKPFNKRKPTNADPKGQTERTPKRDLFSP